MRTESPKQITRRRFILGTGAIGGAAALGFGARNAHADVPPVISGSGESSGATPTTGRTSLGHEIYTPGISADGGTTASQTSNESLEKGRSIPVQVIWSTSHGPNFNDLKSENSAFLWIQNKDQLDKLWKEKVAPNESLEFPDTTPPSVDLSRNYVFFIAAGEEKSGQREIKIVCNISEGRVLIEYGVIDVDPNKKITSSPALLVVIPFQFDNNGNPLKLIAARTDFSLPPVHN